jgi:hypothetical protein
MGVGQIDLASFEKESLIKVYEVKSSVAEMNYTQDLRIKKAAELIGHLFSAAVLIKIISG